MHEWAFFLLDLLFWPNCEAKRLGLGSKWSPTVPSELTPGRTKSRLPIVFALSAPRRAPTSAYPFNEREI